LPQDRRIRRNLNVRTAWHGPGDVSPIGHCANVALDISCYNFGIQEYWPWRPFKGVPWLPGEERLPYANEARLGVEIDEKAAAKHPFGYPAAKARARGSASLKLAAGGGRRKRDGSDYQAVICFSM
jgi:mannonate dehydratase